ncbi:hypothetical protein ACFQUU_16020 [Herbaspirillum sp. GCM10030257]|uniref:hypothetical protein n=1 Tax=Herbaspirillum sp. GCM10030257 TaxID=3273393 RepID=UPI003619D291
MQWRFNAIGTVSLLALLSACGGGDGVSSLNGGNSGTTSQFRPEVQTSEGTFRAYSTVSVPDGATISGIVRLEVRGLRMANVELLTAEGYTPRFGVFNVSADQTKAWFDLDTTKLPNGPIRVRASAFNVPAGQPGATELIALEPRTWNINNAISSVDIPLSISSVSAPLDGAVLSGVTKLEVRGTGLGNAELLPASGYVPRLGKFNVSKDKTYAWLDLDTSSIPDGVQEVRISAYNVTDGQPNATEIVAMPARRWQFSNGTSNSFTAALTSAPAHGAIVGGLALLEVRGQGLENVELLPANGYTPIHGRFTISPDKTYAYYLLDTIYYPTERYPGGYPLNARISAFSVPPGQLNAREIIVMPAREWRLIND